MAVGKKKKKKKKTSHKMAAIYVVAFPVAATKHNSFYEPKTES